MNRYEYLIFYLYKLIYFMSYFYKIQVIEFSK